MSISYLIHFDLVPECVDEFLVLLNPVLDAMRRETSFVSAVLHRDRVDPYRYVLYETWSDAADVERVQVHRGYRQAYWDRLPFLLRKPRVVEQLVALRSDLAAPPRPREARIR